MLLSFIIPVYNNATAFAQCAGSLKPLLESGMAEIVAIDDGSDEPLSVSGSGIRLIRIEHRGAAAARNAGIDIAQGDFIWPVDADDTIVTECIQPLVNDLKTMPPDAALFHIGDMLTLSRPDGTLPSVEPQADRTRQCSPLQLLFPRSSIADHTTNIIRRQWLIEHPDIRYPEDMHLLEDTVFALNVVEEATLCCTNATYRHYVRQTYYPSSTEGAWSVQRSNRFTDDICRFFTFLKQYVKRHDDEEIQRFYQRYRYVYLRVMAVKGCAWSDICRLMVIVGPVRRCQWPFYRLLAFICRTLRTKR